MNRRASLLLLFVVLCSAGCGGSYDVNADCVGLDARDEWQRNARLGTCVHALVRPDLELSPAAARSTVLAARDRCDGWRRGTSSASIDGHLFGGCRLVATLQAGATRWQGRSLAELGLEGVVPPDGDGALATLDELCAAVPTFAHEDTKSACFMLAELEAAAGDPAAAERYEVEGCQGRELAACRQARTLYWRGGWIEDGVRETLVAAWLQRLDSTSSGDPATRRGLVVRIGALATPPSTPGLQEALRATAAMRAQGPEVDLEHALATLDAEIARAPFGDEAHGLLVRAGGFAGTLPEAARAQAQAAVHERIRRVVDALVGDARAHQTWYAALRGLERLAPLGGEALVAPALAEVRERGGQHHRREAERHLAAKRFTAAQLHAGLARALGAAAAGVPRFDEHAVVPRLLVAAEPGCEWLLPPATATAVGAAATVTLAWTTCRSEEKRHTDTKRGMTKQTIEEMQEVTRDVPVVKERICVRTASGETCTGGGISHYEKRTEQVPVRRTVELPYEEHVHTREVRTEVRAEARFRHGERSWRGAFEAAPGAGLERLVQFIIDGRPGRTEGQRSAVTVDSQRAVAREMLAQWIAAQTASLRKTTAEARVAAASGAPPDVAEQHLAEALVIDADAAGDAGRAFAARLRLTPSQVVGAIRGTLTP